MGVPSPITGYAFTPEDSQRGALAVRRQTRERLAERAGTVATINTILEAVQEGAIGQVALEASATAILRAIEALEGDGVEVSTVLDVQRLAETAQTLHKIHRLVTGQSTSNAASLSATVNVDELASRVTALRDAGPTTPAT